MRRSTFDTWVSVTGLGLAGVLFLAGGLLTWASVFIGGQVHDQLAAQKIFFPAASSPAVAGAAFAPMRQYAGQQLTTGAQARVYANDFIRIHLGEVAHGQTYAQVSAQAQAAPTNTKLLAQADTLFKGNTLRGLLLNAYAFGKMASIALVAAIGAYVAAGLMLVASVLGFRHSKRVDRRSRQISSATTRVLPTSAGEPGPSTAVVA